MNPNTIFYPFVGMMILTGIVWLHMLITRIRYMRQNRIAPQKMATSSQVSQVIPPDVNRPADNLANLCELPVVFYALCLMIYVTQQVDGVIVTLAWLYLLFRVLHSLIQCTINKVMWRFYAYLASSVVLWAMVGKAVWVMLG